MSARIARACPSCGDPLRVERLACDRCGTRVEGSYRLPRLARLKAESRELVELLVLSSGSLKAVARQLRISYPTVRKRIDGLIEELEREIEVDARARREALERVAEGHDPPRVAAQRIQETET